MKIIIIYRMSWLPHVYLLYFGRGSCFLKGAKLRRLTMNELLKKSETQSIICKHTAVESVRHKGRCEAVRGPPWRQGGDWGAQTLN